MGINELFKIGLRASELSCIARIRLQGDPKPARIKKARSGKIYNARHDLITSLKWDVKSQYREPVYSGPVIASYIFAIQIPKSWTKAKKKAALSREIFPGKPDYDNLKKTYNDIIKGIVIQDDSQIVAGTYLKIYDENPRVEVDIYEMPK